MLDVHLLCNKLDYIITCLSKRGVTFDAKTFNKLNSDRCNMIHQIESLKARHNNISKQISHMKQTNIDASEVIITQRELNNQIKKLEILQKDINTNFHNFIATIPNIIDESVPIGQNADSNLIIKTCGMLPNIQYPLDHVTLGTRLNILDIDRAVKLSGARFAILKGLGAKLERAIISLMADIHTSNGWIEILPPYLVLSKCMFGTGQIPKFEADAFKTEYNNEFLFLIPTAEVPVTNMHREEIISENQLPLRYFSSTPCFRSEAGNYGKDIKGIIRQHQFNKVELVSFTTPETAQMELEYITTCAEKILDILELPYRRILLSTGETGFASKKTFDLEVWLPSQKNYREISSCSWFGSFQARRANIKYRSTHSNKLNFLNTLNGSGLAVGRTWVAIIENYQQKDGSIKIPKALQPYMGCNIIE